MKRLNREEINQHAEALVTKYVAMCSKDSVKILKLAAKKAIEIRKRAKEERL